MSQALFIVLAVLVVLVVGAPLLIEPVLLVTAIAWRGHCPRGMLVAGAALAAVYGVIVLVAGIVGALDSLAISLAYAAPFAFAAALLIAATVSSPAAGLRRVLSVLGLAVGSGAIITAAVIAARSAGV